MNGLFGRSLLKGLFLVFSLHARCQEDSVSRIADTRLRTSGFRTFLMGKNYRDEWTTPVKAPILDLKSLNITSIKEGGGKETRSLHIEEDSAKKFDLRSVEKFPENAVPSELLDLPPIGEITKLEVLYFVLYHTQRHIHQLKNVIRHI